jgi:hypothetical protein
MATEYTASLASGYMTNVMADVAIGPFRCFIGHYSAPSADTGYVNPGMTRILFVNVQDADPTTYQQTANSVGGKTLSFSGLVTGSTGEIFILGF